MAPFFKKFFGSNPESSSTADADPENDQDQSDDQYPSHPQLPSVDLDPDLLDHDVDPLIQDTLEQEPAPEDDLTETVDTNTPDQTADMSDENQKRAGRLSAGAKRIAADLYKSIADSSFAQRIRGRIEIAYNQFWVNRYEDKSAKTKDKINLLNNKIATLDKSLDDLKDLMSEADKQKINRELTDLMKKKSELTTKFNTQEKQASLFKTKRDRIADRLIEHYNEKLSPLEQDLQNLENKKAELELSEQELAAQHAEQQAEIDELEEAKKEAETALRNHGYSERKIRNNSTIVSYESSIAEAKQAIKTAKENLAIVKEYVEAETIKIQAKMGPYQDKKKEFERLKLGRPLDSEIASAKKEAKKSPDSTTGNKPESKKEKPESEQKKNQEFIDLWNQFLLDTQQSAELTIDPDVVNQRFLLKTDHDISFSDFRKLANYYVTIQDAELKRKTRPKNQLDKILDTFYQDHIKEK